MSLGWPLTSEENIYLSKSWYGKKEKSKKMLKICRKERSVAGVRENESNSPKYN